jgi:hypothetical protein
MEKITITIKEQRHINRVKRAIERFAHDLENLHEQAVVNETFPNSTKKAYIEALTILHHFSVRVAVRDAGAI